MKFLQQMLSHQLHEFCHDLFTFCELPLTLITEKWNISNDATDTKYTYFLKNLYYSLLFERTGKPGVLQSMGHKESDTTEQLN